MNNKDSRKRARLALEAVRRHAVEAVVSGSMTQTTATEVFGVTHVTLSRWIKAYLSRQTERLERQQ